MPAFGQVFLDEPFGHSLSIGVICVSIHLALDGFNFVHPDVWNHCQSFLGHGNKPGLRGDLDGIRG
jgi:hypothetical protein